MDAPFTSFTDEASMPSRPPTHIEKVYDRRYLIDLGASGHDYWVCAHPTGVCAVGACATHALLQQIKTADGQLKQGSSITFSRIKGQDLELIKTNGKKMSKRDGVWTTPHTVVCTIAAPAAEADAQPTEEAGTQPTGEAHAQPTGEADTQPAGEADTQPAGEADTQPAGEAHTKPTEVQFVAGIEGKVLQVNTALQKDLSLLLDRPYDDGYLFVACVFPQHRKKIMDNGLSAEAFCKARSLSLDDVKGGYTGRSRRESTVL